MASTDDFETPVFCGNRLSHAYIVCQSLTDDLAMSVVCSSPGHRPCRSCVHCEKASKRIHPDITIIDIPESKREITVDQIRRINENVIVVPNDSEKKAYIIKNADAMNIPAQNALLRTLEDPPSHTVFILVTSLPAALLHTVRSRCVQINSRQEFLVREANTLAIANDFFTACENGYEGLAKTMFQLEKLDKPGFADFLEAATEIAVEKAKDAALNGSASQAALYLHTQRLLSRAGDFLDRNVGIGHIAGLLCAGNPFMK